MHFLRLSGIETKARLWMGSGLREGQCGIILQVYCRYAWQAVVISNTACSICRDGINVLYQKDSGSAKVGPKRKHTPIPLATWPMHKIRPAHWAEHM